MQVAKNFTIGEKIKAKKYFSNIHANVRKFVDLYQKDRLTNYLYWKVESNANDVEVECSRKLEFHNNNNTKTNPLLHAKNKKNKVQNTYSSNLPMK